MQLIRSTSPWWIGLFHCLTTFVGGTRKLQVKLNKPSICWCWSCQGSGVSALQLNKTRQKPWKFPRDYWSGKMKLCQLFYLRQSRSIFDKVCTIMILWQALQMLTISRLPFSTKSEARNSRTSADKKFSTHRKCHWNWMSLIFFKRDLAEWARWFSMFVRCNFLEKIISLCELPWWLSSVSDTTVSPSDSVFGNDKPN